MEKENEAVGRNRKGKEWEEETEKEEENKPYTQMRIL